MITSNSKNPRRSRRYTLMSEINVTPFVDVMLVLLIVFMVTAPLLTVGIPVDLPKIKANALTDQKDPIEITVKLDGSVYLGESLVEVENLIPRLNAITEQNTEARIYIRGDRVVAYGRIMEIMSIINSLDAQSATLPLVARQRYFTNKVVCQLFYGRIIKQQSWRQGTIDLLA